MSEVKKKIKIEKKMKVEHRRCRPPSRFSSSEDYLILVAVENRAKVREKVEWREEFCFETINSGIINQGNTAII